MSCCSCFSASDQSSPKRSRSSRRKQSPLHTGAAAFPRPDPPASHCQRQLLEYNPKPKEADETPAAAAKGKDAQNAQTFTFRELATATRNFRKDCLIGEGGFGRVYKGKLGKTGQVVAVKQLNPNGLQGNREFLMEVLMLSLLHHENLVNLIGYCADGDQRLLVYEYMPLGSLEDHLLDLKPKQKPLTWSTRMKIALGAAKGLGYLHYKANPPVIYRDLKPSNILLNRTFDVKLSDFGLAKVGHQDENQHVASRVMGTYGYCAPEYQRTGLLTIKSDVYSFGVVLLELITGRRVIDSKRPPHQQHLVQWAKPICKDTTRFSELADPLLKGDFPTVGLNQAIGVAAMCLHEEAAVRPMISDVVAALSFLGPDSDAGTAAAAGTALGASCAASDANERMNEAQQEHRRAVADAMEWVSTSRHVQQQHPPASSLT